MWINSSAWAHRLGVSWAVLDITDLNCRPAPVILLTTGCVQAQVDLLHPSTNMFPSHIWIKFKFFNESAFIFPKRKKSGPTAQTPIHDFRNTLLEPTSEETEPVTLVPATIGCLHFSCWSWSTLHKHWYSQSRDCPAVAPTLQTKTSLPIHQGFSIQLLPLKSALDLRPFPR